MSLTKGNTAVTVADRLELQSQIGVPQGIMPALGRVVDYYGDSITATSGVVASQGFAKQSQLLVGELHLSSLSTNLGVPGERSDQILTRMRAGLPTSSADTVHILMGTNDALQLVAPSVFRANLIEALDLCKAYGKKIEIGTVTPYSGAEPSGPDKRKLIQAYNLLIKMIAPLYGAIVHDYFSALVDPVTEKMQAAFDGDLTHPNADGYRAMARTRAANIKLDMGTRPNLVDTLAAANLITNPMMTGAGPLPTGWAELSGGTGTAPTYSIVDDVSSRLPTGARWAQMDFDAVAGGTRRLRTVLSGSSFAVGDVLALTYQAQIEDVSGYEAHSLGGSPTAFMTIGFLNGSSGAALKSEIVCPGPDLGPALSLYTVGAGVTSILVAMNATLPTGDRAKFRLGTPGVFNLTALGLASLILG